MDSLGAEIDKYPLRQKINYYVFILDEEIWKLGNFMDITDPKQALQDWDFMSQDLKNITGEINTFAYKDCGNGK